MMMMAVNYGSDNAWGIQVQSLKYKINGVITMIIIIMNNKTQR